MRIRTAAVTADHAPACRHAESAVLDDRRTRTADAVPPLLSVAALVLAGVTPVHWVLEPGRASLLVAAVCGGLALVFAAARASLRWSPVRAFVRRHPDDVVLTACVLASVAAAIELLVFARPVSAGGLVVFLLGAGVLTVRRRDALLVTATVLTEWFAVAWWQGFTGAWGPLSVLVVCAAVVAHVLEVIRRRATDQLARAESTILEAAVTDELTGLQNRRGLVAAGEHQLREHPGEALSVVYVDLDGLKRTNDEQGHAAGDRLLLDAATVLSRSTRPTDVVARLGGDEFAALLPSTTADDAQLTRHRLERALAAAGVRASVGTATSVASSEPAQALTALLDRADAAMYVEKERRRSAPASPSPARPDRSQESSQDVHRPHAQAADRLVHLPRTGSTAALDLLGLARVAAWLHLALVPVHLVLLPTGPARAMVAVSLAIAALCAVIALRPLRARVTGRAESLMCLVMVALCAETVGYSALAPER